MYVNVSWTTGDTLTEAKLDNMVANDRAEDAHESGLYMLNSTGIIKFKDSGGTNDAQIYEDSNDVLQFVQGANGFAGLDINLAVGLRGAIASGSNIAQFPPAPRDFTIKEVLVRKMHDGVVPTGDMTFDINLNGTTIWSTQANRLKLLDSASQGVQTTFDVTAVSKYDNLSLDGDVTDSVARHLYFIIIGE